MPVPYTYKSGSAIRTSTHYTKQEIDRKLSRVQGKLFNVALGSLKVGGTLTIGDDGSLDWAGGTLDSSGLQINLEAGPGSDVKIRWGTAVALYGYIDINNNRILKTQANDRQQFDVGGNNVIELFDNHIINNQFTEFFADIDVNTNDIRFDVLNTNISGSSSDLTLQVANGEINLQDQTVLPTQTKLTFKDSGGNLNNSLSVDGANDLKVEVAGSDQAAFKSNGNTQLFGNLLVDTIEGSLTAGVTFSQAVTMSGNLDHDGTNVGFYGVSPTTQASSPTAQDGSTVDSTYGTEEEGVIKNNRTRIQEVITALQNIGIMA